MAVSVPLRRQIKILKLMIGRASHLARRLYSPVTELVPNHVLYHLLAQWVKLQLLQLQNKRKKGGVGRTWAREHLRLISVLRSKY